MSEAITYRAQCARDAQEMNYGAKSYWDYLEQSSIEHYDKGIPDALTRTLAEALSGNDGN